MKRPGGEWDEMGGGECIGTDGRPSGGTETEFGEQSEHVTQFLTQLRTLGDCSAPEPSPELAVAFAGARPLRAKLRPPRRRRVALVTAVAVATVGITGVAAAKDALPAPAERLVSRVVENVTPFHLGPADGLAPNPARRPPVPGPTAVPPEHESSAEPGPEPANAAPPAEDDAAIGHDGGNDAYGTTAGETRGTGTDGGPRNTSANGDGTYSDGETSVAVDGD